MDAWDGIIIGAAVSAVIGVVVTQYMQKGPQGGGQGLQPAYPGQTNFNQKPLYVVDLVPTPSGAAPVAQVNPNTEAAYNVQPVEFVHAFGPGVNTAPDGEQQESLPQ
jgi:hypothetical protein